MSILKMLPSQSPARTAWELDENTGRQQFWHMVIALFTVVVHEEDIVYTHQ